jgi:hypothetical protein
LAGPKSATQVESHSLHPIRIVGAGGALHGSPPRNEFHHSARLARLHAACSDGIHKPQSFGSPQHEAATDAGRREGNGCSCPLFACMALPLPARKTGLRTQVFNCQAETSDRGQGRPVPPGQRSGLLADGAQFEEAANPSTWSLALVAACEGLGRRGRPCQPHR